MQFFHLNFVSVGSFLAQKLYNAHIIFCHFFTLKMGNDPKNQASSVSSLLVNPIALELAVLRIDNIIFQVISLSNATLFSIVYLGCCVRKFSYIKNDFA